MQHRRNVAIPDALADICHPIRMIVQRGPACSG
jgi:hypothetical protein